MFYYVHLIVFAPNALGVLSLFHASYRSCIKPPSSSLYLIFFSFSRLLTSFVAIQHFCIRVQLARLSCLSHPHTAVVCGLDEYIYF